MRRLTTTLSNTHRWPLDVLVAIASEVDARTLGEGPPTRWRTGSPMEKCHLAPGGNIDDLKQAGQLSICVVGGSAGEARGVLPLLRFGRLCLALDIEPTTPSRSLGSRLRSEDPENCTDLYIGNTSAKGDGSGSPGAVPIN